jgi:hypothetical protein
VVFVVATAVCIVIGKIVVRIRRRRQRRAGPPQTESFVTAVAFLGLTGSAGLWTINSDAARKCLKHFNRTVTVVAAKYSCIISRAYQDSFILVSDTQDADALLSAILEIYASMRRACHAETTVACRSVLHVGSVSVVSSAPSEELIDGHCGPGVDFVLAARLLPAAWDIACTVVDGMHQSFSDRGLTLRDEQDVLLNVEDHSVHLHIWSDSSRDARPATLEDVQLMPVFNTFDGTDPLQSDEVPYPSPGNDVHTPSRAELMLLCAHVLDSLIKIMPEKRRRWFVAKLQESCGFEADVPIQQLAQTLFGAMDWNELKTVAEAVCSRSSKSSVLKESTSLLDLGGAPPGLAPAQSSRVVSTEFE